MDYVVDEDADRKLLDSARDLGMYAHPLPAGYLKDALGVRFAGALQQQAERAAAQARLWHQIISMLTTLTGQDVHARRRTEPVTPVAISKFISRKG